MDVSVPSSSTKGLEGAGDVLKGSTDLLQWVPGVKQLKFEQEDANRVWEGTTDPLQCVSLQQLGSSRWHLQNLLCSGFSGHQPALKNVTVEVRGCWALLLTGSTSCLGGSSKVGSGKGFSSSSSGWDSELCSSSSCSQAENNPSRVTHLEWVPFPHFGNAAWSPGAGNRGQMSPVSLLMPCHFGCQSAARIQSFHPSPLEIPGR